MHQPNQKEHRVCAIAPTTRGFGFAVMEGESSLLAFGSKRVNGNKNARSMDKIAKLIKYYRPDVVVLPDVNATDARRADRIKTLQRIIVDLTHSQKLKAVVISGKRVRQTLLGNPKGTKHEVAAAVGARFPNELSSLLPPKRRAWDSEDRRMDMFDAVGLAVAFRESGKRTGNGSETPTDLEDAESE